jgi:hypothetical protein
MAGCESSTHNPDHHISAGITAVITLILTSVTPYTTKAPDGLDSALTQACEQLQKQNDHDDHYSGIFLKAGFFPWLGYFLAVKANAITSDKLCGLAHEAPAQIASSISKVQHHSSIAQLAQHILYKSKPGKNRCRQLDMVNVALPPAEGLAHSTKRLRESAFGCTSDLPNAKRANNTGFMNNPNSREDASFHPMRTPMQTHHQHHAVQPDASNLESTANPARDSTTVTNNTDFIANPNSRDANLDASMRTPARALSQYHAVQANASNPESIASLGRDSMTVVHPNSPEDVDLPPMRLPMQTPHQSNTVQPNAGNVESTVSLFRDSTPVTNIAPPVEDHPFQFEADPNYQLAWPLAKNLPSIFAENFCSWIVKVNKRASILATFPADPRDTCIHVDVSARYVQHLVKELYDVQVDIEGGRRRLTFRNGPTLTIKDSIQFERVHPGNIERVFGSVISLACEKSTPRLEEIDQG